MDDYLEALFKEMEFTARRMAGKTLDTVYIGGGTPTSLSAEHLEKLILRLKNTFDFKIKRIYSRSRKTGQHNTGKA